MRIVTHKNGNVSKYEESLIACYIQVFAAPPWNEEWWTPPLVRDVLAQYAGDSVTYVFAVDGNDVVGFALGAYWRVDKLAEELSLDIPYLSNQLVGYVKDVGVHVEYRNQGLAQQMLQKLTKSLSQDVGNGPLLARTLATPEPSVVYRWFPKLGFQVVAHYSEGTDRFGQVILGVENINNVSF